MLVKLSNDWFDGQGYRKKDIPFEYYGKEEDLPTGAVVLSKKGVLPDLANTPKAGFGAKPVEEQLLDAAGAGPTHQIEVGSGGGEGIGLTPEEQREKEREATEQRVNERDEAEKKAEAEGKEAGKELEKVLPDLAKAEEKAKEANDPLAALNTRSSAKK